MQQSADFLVLEVQDSQHSCWSAAFFFGISQGAWLALEAAGRLPGGVRRLFMYEASLILDDSCPPVPADYVKRLAQETAAGRRGEASLPAHWESVMASERVLTRGDSEPLTRFSFPILA